MTTYTSVNCTAIIKPEYSSLIGEMMSDWSNWEELYETNPQYAFLQEMSTKYRSSFIPFGVLMGEPSSWDTSIEFTETTREWSFMCSINNCDNTIEAFFDLVLSRIAEKIIHLETSIETSYTSKFYSLVDSKIVSIESSESDKLNQDRG